jgi:hypothetical protein
MEFSVARIARLLVIHHRRKVPGFALAFHRFCRENRLALHGKNSTCQRKESVSSFNHYFHAFKVNISILM